MLSMTRDEVLGYRVRAQQLDRESGSLDDTTILDMGVQDTGPDGAPWALAMRSVDSTELTAGAVAMAWTLRGAPHYYRRQDLPGVAAAVWPYSDTDADKRVFDASKPLKAAGIETLAALDAVAEEMRSIVTEPMVKGEVSTLLTSVMPEPYLRFCRPCDATHLYEMTFRLAALRAGLELQPGTSPPVLRPIPAFAYAAERPPRFDPIRAYLRFLGPATHKQVAEFVDSPVREVKAHWPTDAREIEVDGETRWLVAEDEAMLTAGPAAVVRLLGPYDLFLQARDRPLLVDDKDRSKSLWPVIGRPGAVLVDGEIRGTWRPRKSGRKLKLLVEPWGRLKKAETAAIGEQAERLAQHRGVDLSAVEIGI